MSLSTNFNLLNKNNVDWQMKMLSLIELSWEKEAVNYLDWWSWLINWSKWISSGFVSFPRSERWFICLDKSELTRKKCWSDIGLVFKAANYITCNLLICKSQVNKKINYQLFSSFTFCDSSWKEETEQERKSKGWSKMGATKQNNTKLNEPMFTLILLGKSTCLPDDSIHLRFKLFIMIILSHSLLAPVNLYLKHYQSQIVSV